MTRTLIASALGLLLTASAASAQTETAPSRTTGFFVGASLVGASFDTDADDDFDPFTGGGAGLELGWGFSSGLALFLGADFGGLKSDDEGVGEGIEQRVQADFGVRMNLGGGRRRLVPYLEAAFSGLVVEAESDNASEVVYSGGGVTVGGGLQYFVRPSLSLNVGLRATAGALTQVEIDDDEQDLDDQHFTTSRVFLGATWHP